MVHKNLFYNIHLCCSHSAVTLPSIDGPLDPVEFTVGVRNSFNLTVTDEDEPITLTTNFTLPENATLEPAGDPNVYNFSWTPQNLDYILLE